MCLKDYCSEVIITFTPWAQLAEILPRKTLMQPLTFSMVGSTPSQVRLYPTSECDASGAARQTYVH